MPRPHLPCGLGSDGPRPPLCSPKPGYPQRVSVMRVIVWAPVLTTPTPQAFSSCLPFSHPTPTLCFAKVVSAFLVGPTISYFCRELLPPTLLLSKKMFAQSSLHAPRLPKAHVWAMQPAQARSAVRLTFQPPALEMTVSDFSPAAQPRSTPGCRGRLRPPKISILHFDSLVIITQPAGSLQCLGIWK